MIVTYIFIPKRPIFDYKIDVGVVVIKNVMRSFELVDCQVSKFNFYKSRFSAFKV